MSAEDVLPRVSIVTLCLNAADQLPITLESVIGQDYANVEYIVYDGMSWDDTGRTLKRYMGLIDSVISSEDPSIYHAMNKAVSYLSGDYVLFMNAGDQFYCANAVSRMVAAIYDAPDIFFGDHVYVNGPLETYRRAAPFEQTVEKLRSGDIDGDWLDQIPCHQATFTSRNLLHQLRYDARLKVNADHELLFRAHQSGARFQYIDQPVCHYYSGGFSEQAGGRTKLEGTSTYRQYSDHPDLVDKFFYPDGAPFNPYTRRTGMPMGGLFPEAALIESAAQSLDGVWMAGAGCEILSPEQVSTGMELYGSCILADQRLDFTVDGELIATTAIPPTTFRQEIAFSRAIPPCSNVLILPTRSEEMEPGCRVDVALRISSFCFQPEEVLFPEGLLPGSCTQMNSQNVRQTSRILGSGWSAAELTHIWAIGTVSDLWLKVDSAAKHVCFQIGGNPHVPHDRQEVQIEINGVSANTVSIAGGQRVDLALDCTRSPWIPGAINYLCFRPSDFAIPPAKTGDKRQLSFCLWTIAID